MPISVTSPFAPRVPGHALLPVVCVTIAVVTGRVPSHVTNPEPLSPWQRFASGSLTAKMFSDHGIGGTVSVIVRNIPY